MRLSEDLDAHLENYGPWLLGDQYTLAEIAWSPFLARLEALCMLDVFFDGKQSAQRWWKQCKARNSFAAAEVGPAAGAEAERFAHCGSSTRAELCSLTDRIRSSTAYDIASRNFSKAPVTVR
jgi:hypothetical protein